MADPVANADQGTPSGSDLDAQLAADELARKAPEPSPEPVEEPEIIEPEAEKPDPIDEQTDFEKRIARLAFQEREARKIARQLTEENARLRGQAPPLEKDDEIVRQVEQRASELAAMKVYNDKANAIYEAGVKEFPDFQSKIDGFKTAGMPLSTELIEAAIEVGDAHRLIHYLGKNLDEAERIMNLKPHQMGAALGKLAIKASAPIVKQQSKTPSPIKPIGGATKAELSDTDMPIDEYMRKEDERVWNRRYRR